MKEYIGHLARVRLVAGSARLHMVPQDHAELLERVGIMFLAVAGDEEQDAFGGDRVKPGGCVGGDDVATNLVAGHLGDDILRGVKDITHRGLRGDGQAHSFAHPQRLPHETCFEVKCQRVRGQTGKIKIIHPYLFSRR